MLYSRPQRRNSYTFNLCNSRMFGKIKKYVILPDLGIFAVVCVLYPLSTPSEYFNLEGLSIDYTNRIFPVKELDSFKLVPISNLCNKCVFMEFSEDEKYVAEMDVDILLD